jgi:hypothetical protein
MIDMNTMKNSPKTPSVSVSTTNWDRFGFYKDIPAATEKVRKAGAVYVVLPNGKRIIARTKSDRTVLRRAVNSLRTPKVEVVEKPVKWTVRLVKARIKTVGGKVLNRICKVKGSNGVQKVFVTKKAALVWVKNQK